MYKPNYNIYTFEKKISNKYIINKQNNIWGINYKPSNKLLVDKIKPINTNTYIPNATIIASRHKRIMYDLEKELYFLEYYGIPQIKTAKFNDINNLELKIYKPVDSNYKIFEYNKNELNVLLKSSCANLFLIDKYKIYEYRKNLILCTNGEFIINKLSIDDIKFNLVCNLLL